MEGKKNRAIFFAVMLMLESGFPVFVLNKALTTEADLKSVFLPVAVFQGVSWAVVLLLLLVQYIVLRKAEADSLPEKRSSLAIGAVTGLLWLGATIQMDLLGLFSVKEILLFLVKLSLLGFFVFKSQFRYHTAEIGDDRHAERRTERILFGRKRLATITLGIQLVIGILEAFLYKNELLSPKRIIVMTLANACVILFAVWGNRLVNLLASCVLLMLQAIVSVYEFVRLNRSSNILAAAEKLMKNCTAGRLLALVMICFTVFLIVSAALQFAGECRVLGKMTSVTLTLLIICVIGTVSGLNAQAEGTLDVDKKDAVTQVEFSVYVAKDSPITQVSELAGKTVGAAGDEQAEELADAIACLMAECPEAVVTTYENTSALLEAYENGEAESFICTRNTLDNMTTEIEEYVDSDRVFEEEVRVLATYEVDYRETEEETGTESTETETGTETEEFTVTVDYEPEAGEKDVTKDAFIIYFSGIDTYGEISTKSRSDVNVIVAVNPVTKQIGLLSTPRDAYVYISGHSSNGKDKLTHAGNYGIECSEKTLQNLYGISIDYYVRINFSSVEKIVDLLGGLDVWSLETFTSRWGYKYTEGWNHVNGKQALVFARERKTVKGGDTVRGKHHIELLKAVIRKITTTSVLTNYQSLLDKAADNFQTDLSTAEIAALVAMQLSDGAEWNFVSYAACGVGTSAWCASYTGKQLYVNNLYDWSVKKGSEMINRVLNGEIIDSSEYQYDK